MLAEIQPRLGSGWHSISSLMGVIVGLRARASFAGRDPLMSSIGEHVRPSVRAMRLEKAYAECDGSS